MTENDYTSRTEESKSIVSEALKEVFINPKLLNDFISILSRFDFSAQDCLLLAKKLPRATHLAAFKDWNDSGYRVKKGEKSITLLDYDGENGNNLFDISQTNAPIPTKVGNNISFSDKFRALLSTTEFPIASVSKTEYTHGQAAYFDSKSKVIFIDRNASFEEIYPALATELSHSHFWQTLGSRYSREKCDTAAQIAGSVICKKNDIKSNEVTIADSLKNFSPQEVKTVLDNTRLISDQLNENIQYFYKNGKAKHEFPKPPQRREKLNISEEDLIKEPKDSKKSIRSFLQEQKKKKAENKYQPKHIKENTKNKGGKI